MFAKNLINCNKLGFSIVSDSSQISNKSPELCLKPGVELLNNTNGITIQKEELLSTDKEFNSENNNECPLEIIQNLKGFRIGHINIAFN